MNRLQRLERQARKVFGPNLVEIPLFRCVFSDGTEAELSAVEFAYEIIGKGRDGQAHERVGTRWESMKAVSDQTARTDVFRELKERFIADQAKFEQGVI